MDKEKLKIGLLIDNYNIAYWQYKIVEEIQNSDFGEVTLVAIVSQPKTNEAFKFFELLQHKERLIFDIHLKLDELILGRSTNYSKIKNSKTILQDADKISLTAGHEEYKNNLAHKDFGEIRNCNLDIILKFSSKSLPGNIFSIPKYGIWSIEPTDNDIKGEPLGYWEVMNEWGTTDLKLQILSHGAGATKVIHRSSLLTNNISISKNRNLCYFRAATVIPRIIQGLYNFGEPYLMMLENRIKKEVNNDRRFYKKFLLFSGLINIFLHFFRVNKRLLRKMFYVDFWQVLYKIDSNDTFVSSLREFKFLPSPSDRFWADPFVISKDDKHFIFVEELIYKTNKGHIAVIEMDSVGNFISSKKVLEKDYHLSYPFLLKHNNTYYMIPETGENKTIELYKCTEFPYKWEFVTNLMEGIRTADVTLFYHDDLWWLFCCIDKSGLHEGILDELYLFYSDDLFSKKWQSHPDNPINTDTRTARPGGKIFIKDNKIYRPSQDCSGIYGKAININQIIKLSRTEYEEKVISKINPDQEKDLIGTHTYNGNDKIIVADGFKYKKRLDIKV